MERTRAALVSTFILMLTGCGAGGLANTPSPPPTGTPTAAATLTRLTATPESTPAPEPTSLESPTREPTVEPTQAPTPAPTVRPTIVASGPCVDVESDAFVIVSSRANIFGAGHDEAPSPGGGGGGELPPLVDVAVSEGTEVTFPCTSGTVDCCSGSMFSAPAGPEGSVWSTRINPYQGLSGILHDQRGVFLAGVFVGEEAPADPAPKSLDFTELCPAECTFETLEPELGQIFYIGLGGEESAYVAPAGASRLYLGIPDAEFVQGAPGWYGNNAGHFEVAVDVR